MKLCPLFTTKEKERLLLFKSYQRHDHQRISSNATPIIRKANKRLKKKIREKETQPSIHQLKGKDSNHRNR